MLASLPMYDLPEVRDATDAFWAAMAKASGVEGGLTRDTDYTSAWRNPDLFFSQTCGYPFTHEFAGVLKYVATPHYDADGCEGPFYRSIVFAREAAPLDSFKGKVAAFNNPDSMSGMLALRLVFAPLADNEPFFSAVVETGGHLNSLLAIQEGRADVASIDCVTVALCRRYRPAALAGLVEIARSPLVPGLPFVTRQRDDTALQSALTEIVGTQGPVLGKLLISGASVLPSDAYDIIPRLEGSISGTRIGFRHELTAR